MSRRAAIKTTRVCDVAAAEGKARYLSMSAGLFMDRHRSLDLNLEVVTTAEPSIGSGTASSILGLTILGSPRTNGGFPQALRSTEPTLNLRYSENAS